MLFVFWLKIGDRLSSKIV